MALVEHAQVQDDTAEHTTFTSPQEQPAGDEAAVGRHGAHAGSHDPPGCCEHREVASSAYDLEQPVRGDVEQDVKDVEDCQGDVELVASQVQLFG